jgi:hypothetical protein
MYKNFFRDGYEACKQDIAAGNSLWSNFEYEERERQKKERKQK